MPKTLKVYLPCPFCEEEIEFQVYGGCPAQTSGPPERCYPAEPAEVDPLECPHCGKSVEEVEQQVLDAAAEQSQEQDEAWIDREREDF